MNIFALVFVAYLIGSIPTAYLIGKWIGKIDIRQHGSGNVGATNVFRVMGKKWGSIALLCDISKGFIVTYFLAGSLTTQAQLLLGLFAIIGHTWPVWLRFHGGKGVATSCGAFLGIFPKAVLLALLVWIIVAFITRYVSASSILSAFSFPFWLTLFYRTSDAFSLSLGVSIALLFFIIFTHRPNIARLLAGTESKIGSKSVKN